MSSNFWLSRFLIFFLMVFLILPGCGITCLNAQNVDSIVSLVKKKFPEEQIIVYDKQTEYEFKYLNSSKDVIVIESTTLKIRSLKPGIKASIELFYNNFVEIADHELQFPKDMKVRDNYLRCGDYEEEGIFYHDSRSCNFLLNFDKLNQEYTLSYIMKYTDLKYFTVIDLIDKYRIAGQKILLKVPDFLKLNLHEMNLDGFNISKTQHYEQKYKQTVYEYSAFDIPPTMDVEDLPGYSCTFPHILVSPEYFITAKGDTTGIFRQPSDLYNWYISVVRNSNISAELAAFTENLVKDADTDIEKIEAVMKWIGERIRYIAFANGTAAYVPEEASEVFIKRYGDCKGMANLAKNMLCHLGFDARLGWVYSGRKCFPDSVLSLSLDNHLICVLKYNEETFYLDATLRFANIHEISESIQGKRCVIENDSGYKIIQIPKTRPEVNTTSISDTIFISGDKLLLAGKMKLSGMSRLSLQNHLSHLSKDKKKELTNNVISSGNNNLKVLSIDALIYNSTDSLFTIRYKIEINNALVKAGNDFLLQPNYRDEFKNLKIRKPRFFKYSIDERSVEEHQIYIQIPPFLTVKKLPDPIIISNEGYCFSAAYESEEGFIMLKTRFVITDDIINPENFDTWNVFIEEIQNFSREMIILTQK